MIMNNRRTTEPTIATKTLRSHPWHDVHSITHRQMAETSERHIGCIQTIEGGVRRTERALIPCSLGAKGWTAEAIRIVDPFQDLGEAESRRYALL